MAEKKHWDENEEVTITRKELATLIGKRLNIEKKLMRENLDNPMVAFLFGEIMQSVCASICALIFKDVTMEELETECDAITKELEDEWEEIGDDEGAE